MHNYRTISLLQISYKIFATIVQQRLKTAHAEDRNWSTQFGIRSGYGTNDVLYLIRRLMDNALATKDNPLYIVALD